MLSEICYARRCPLCAACSVRFASVCKGEFVYCPDGYRELVD